MAWTDIPNSSIESGAPIRAVDGLALRDNPIAIANGDTGAPRIQNAAIQNGVIGAEKLQTGSTEVSWTLARLAGTTSAVVGSYTIAYYQDDPTLGISYNATTSGANLYAMDVLTSSTLETIGLTGTWRAIGSAAHYGDRTKLRGAILWVRIA